MYLVNSLNLFSIDISSYWSSLQWTMMSLISSKLNHNDNLGLSSTLLIFDTLNFSFKTICRLNLFVFVAWEDSHIKMSLFTASVLCSWYTFMWEKIFIFIKNRNFFFLRRSYRSFFKWNFWNFRCARLTLEIHMRGKVVEAHSQETYYGGTDILYPKEFFSLAQVQIPKIKLRCDLYPDSIMAV